LENWFRLYGLTKGTGNKCEVTILGGSFTKYPRDYLISYTKAIYEFFNQSVDRNLEDAIRTQEYAPDRCVAFGIETRPDLISEDTCEFLLSLGVTLVEIGVQSLDETVLELNRRDQSVETVKRATHLLRSYGFKIGYHMMVGLPGSTWENDVDVFRTQLWQADLCPDYLKIYPCIMLKGAYKQIGLASRVSIDWQPLTNETYEKFLYEIKPHIPPFVKVSRVQRIMPSNHIAKGPFETIDRSKFRGICKCITHRSAGLQEHCVDGDFRDYRVTSCKQGDGYYVEAVLRNGTVLGYGRISASLTKHESVVRQLRTFGRMMSVGKTNENARGVQHIGIGKSIMRHLEEISLGLGCNMIKVNAGIGVREYFERIGYTKKGYYMSTEKNGVKSTFDP
jgi:elongator complex protein 3